MIVGWFYRLDKQVHRVPISLLLLSSFVAGMTLTSTISACAGFAAGAAGCGSAAGTVAGAGAAGRPRPP